MKQRRRDIGQGSLFQHPGCKRWVIQYYQDGRRIRKATGLASKRAAQDMLTELLNQVNRGEAPALRKPVRVAELFRDLEDYVKVNRPKGLRELRWRLGHLRPAFAHVLAPNVTTDSLIRYASTRQEEVGARTPQGAANATINRELATLRRAFNLARRCSPPKVRDVPYFPMLEENNVRKGFVEDADFDCLAANCDEPWLRTFLELAFTYGWRLSELLALRVRQLNFATRAIRLDAGTTKNKEGREVTMTARLFELLRAATADKGPDDFVLTYENGEQVRDLRSAWQRLCERAGLAKFVCRACGQSVPGGGKCRHEIDGQACGARRPKYEGLLRHDMRRSAAKALRAAGVPESVIMATGGWKTAAMFRRYAIVSSADQRAAVEMLERARAALRSQEAVPKLGSSPKTALIRPESTTARATGTNRKVQ